MLSPSLSLIAVSRCCVPPLPLPAAAEDEEAPLEDDEAEAEEELEELVKEAIDPAVAAENARLVEEFKAKMKVGNWQTRTRVASTSGQGELTAAEVATGWLLRP